MTTFLIVIAASLLSGAAGAFLMHRTYLPRLEETLRHYLKDNFNAWCARTQQHLDEHMSDLAKARDAIFATQLTNLTAEVARTSAQNRIELQRALHERVDAVLADVEPRLLETLKVQFREAMEQAVRDMGEDVSEADKARFMNAFHW